MSGTFTELIGATHQRTIINGELDKDSFNNDYEGVIHHEYKCYDCKRIWIWVRKPKLKWLSDLMIKAYKED